MTPVVERLRRLGVRVKAGPIPDLDEASALAGECEELLRCAEASQDSLGPEDLLRAIQATCSGVVTRTLIEVPVGVTTAHDALPLVWQVIAACRLAAACKVLVLRCSDMVEPINQMLTGGMLDMMIHTGAHLARILHMAGPAGGCTHQAALLVEAQLQAMRLCLLTGAHLAFRAELLHPMKLADWLDALVELFDGLQAAPPAAPSKAILEQVQLRHLPALCYTLFCNPAFAPLQTALLQGSLPDQLVASCASALARLSVLLALPADRRPNGVSWSTARPLAGLFTLGPLEDAIERWFNAASASQLVALLVSSAQLMAQLPIEERPEGLPAAADEHSATAATLCLSLSSLCLKAAKPQPTRALGTAQRRRVAPALLAALAQLPGALQLVGAALDMPEASLPHNHHLLQVPSAASSHAVSTTVSAISSLTALLQDWTDQAATGHLSTQAQPQPLMQGLGDISPWARAATAALRCGPALAAIDRRLDQLPSRPQLPATELPPMEVLEQLLLFTARVVTMIGVAAEAADTPLPAGCPPLPEIRASLWSLHTAGCRFIHWAVADGWCCLSSSLHMAQSLLRVLNEVAKAQLDLHTLEQEQLSLAGHAQTHASGSASREAKYSRTCRELEAVCAAHWPAVQALAANAHLESFAGVPGCSKLAISLAICMGKGPPSLVADGDLRSMFGAMLAHIPPILLERWTHYRLVFLASKRSPRWAAHLAISGRLEAMSQEVEAANTLGVGTLAPNGVLGGAWTMSSEALLLEAKRLSKTPGLQPETRTALKAGRRALAGLVNGQASVPASQRARNRQRQAQAMRDLAQVLQQVWELPEQQEAARLETAQAAAARSCAYLRCANLGGGGGPAAGEGSGSSRCSACRTAWYCGEACSHADWRGPTGHHKACKALRAARKAQKESAAAEVAAADAAAV